MSDRDPARETADEPASTEDAAPAGAQAETSAGDGARPSPAGRREAGPYVVWGLVVLVVFLAGLAAWPLLAPHLPKSWRGAGGAETQVAIRLAALERRLEALEGKLAAQPDRQAVDLRPLEQGLAAESRARQESVTALGGRLDALQQRLEAQPATSAAPSEAIERLSARVDDLEQRLTAAASASETAKATQDELGALDARVEALEKSVASAKAAARKDSLVLAVGQLAAAVDKGRAYRGELDRLSGLAGEDVEVDSAIDMLDPMADQGVTGLAELRRRFDGLAGAIVRAGAAPPGEGWLDSALRRLKDLVTVRRTGEVEGNATDAIVARAEVRLADGDLAGALRELEALEGPAADAAAVWRRAAEARLLAERAVARLQARAIELLGQS